MASKLLSPDKLEDVQNAQFIHLVENYERYYASGSTHTAHAKRLDLDHFVAFLKEYSGCSKVEKVRVRDWDFSATQRFVDSCLARGEAPATVARRLATLKHMGRTLADKVAGFVNPAREVKTPRIQAAKPQALSEEEIDAVERRAEERKSVKNSFIRQRNEVLFSFLLDTGLRADEARLLRRNQLDEKLEWIKNVRTKGRRYRNVYITSAMRPRLQEYLEARDREIKRFIPKLSRKLDGTLPLFISNYNADPSKPESFCLGAKTLWRAINELSKNTSLHPHLLRHSYALELLKHSNDIRLVSQALGHSDVKVTMRYTERRDEEVAHALEKARQKPRGAAGKSVKPREASNR